ncbi:MAG: integrase [Betaproteobacteria bacterium]
MLQRFNYAALGRRERGWVLRYLRATGGYSRSQLTRLVHLALAGLPLAQRRHAPRCPFPRHYTEADILLLAEVDRQFDTLSGPATAHLLRRAWTVYADARFERLATLSVAHLYNLRASFRYTAQRLAHTRTRPTPVAIGSRRAPAPEGRPGFIRVDSVHQGDLDGVKGVYYVNAVDCVTQGQIVACCERISEAYLLPVLEQLLAQFPFALLGFHADNGSEYINARVARLLEKLRIELTKSRPRHCNDNALAETKNGAVIRKTFGYGHIPQRHAAPINAFCRERLNPFLNLHRPCLFATEIADPAKLGRIRKVYRPHDAITPLEELARLAAAESFLRPDHGLAELQAQARAQTDLLAADALNRARLALFERIRRAA